MSQITALEPARRRRGRVNLYVDDRFLMSVSQAVVEEKGLRPGEALDADAIAALQSRDSFQQAYESALRFLATRPRSEQEIRQNLTRKDIPADLQEQVIERLRRLGYVNDAAFARYWVENRERFNPRGERLLKVELRQKGVATTNVDAAVAESVDEGAGAETVALRYAPRLAKLDYQSFRQRLWGHLARRGFDYDAIGPAVEAAWRALVPP